MSGAPVGTSSTPTSSASQMLARALVTVVLNMFALLYLVGQALV